MFMLTFAQCLHPAYTPDSTNCHAQGHVELAGDYQSIQHTLLISFVYESKWNPLSFDAQGFSFQHIHGGKVNVDLLKSIWGIGVRGVFLQRGGISQPSILLACFNSAGGVNAGLWNSLKGDVSLSCFGEGGNFVLTNLGPTILDRCTHEGKTFLWKTILSSKILGIGKD